MAERPQGFARRMMAQQLASDARADPFSDSRFFSGKIRPSLADMENPTRFEDIKMPAYQAGATGSLFLPGAGIADYFGKAPDPANPGQLLPGFSDNVQQGKYIDAVMQTGGAAGDVAMAAGALFPPAFPAAAALSTLLKGPRAGRLASGIDNAVDATRGDPNQVAGSAMDAAQARYFETGKFEPPTAENPVSIVPPTETEPGIIAFHGSGADFDEFRLEMIGTGEGAQAYGYGLYFTDSEDIAKFYKETVQYNQRMRGSTLKINYQGKPFEDLGDTAAAEAAPPSYNAVMSISDEMFAYLPANPEMAKPEAAKERILSRIDANIERYSKAGQADADVESVQLDGGGTLEELILADLRQQKQALLDINSDDIQPATGKIYKVGIAPKPEELLDYDLSLRQQPQFAGVLKPLYDEYGVAETADIGTLFESIKGARGISARDLTDRLSKAGIPGIKYRAAGSRATTTADEAAERNYVIFDDKAVKILEKYGIVGPVAITAGVAGAARSGNDNEDGGSILPDAGVM